MENKTSFTISATDRASYAVLGVAAKFETLNKSIAKTSSLSYAFGELGKQLAPIGERMSQLGNKWGQAARRMSYTGLVVGGAAAGLTKFAQGAAEAADNVGDLAERYMLSTRSLQVFGSMLKDSGFGLEETAAGMGKLKKSMNEALNGDNKSAVSAFAGIGISLERLKKMRPEEVMLSMADAFKGSEKDFAKQAVLLELMGKNGTVFMAAMNKGSGEYRARLKEMIDDNSLLDDQQIALGGRFADKWGRMSRTLEGLKVRLGLQLAARLEPLLDKFQNWLVGGGAKKISAEFDKIFTSANIQAFTEMLLALGKIVLSVGKGLKWLIDNIGATNTAWLGLGIVLAPVGDALFAAGKALWYVGRAMVFLVGKIPGVSAGLEKTAAMFAAVEKAAMASLPGLKVWALRVATIFYPITVATTAIFAAFKAYEAYQRLSETQAGSAADTGVRNDKRAAYDNVLRSVGGEKFAAAYGENADFQTLNTVVSGLERGGKVATGTAARLAALPVDVSGKMTIEVTASNGATAKITELKKKGVLDFDVTTGPLMAGG